MHHMQSLCVWLFPFFAGLCHAELTRELSREAERLGLSSALGLSWNMALQVSALALLLALPPLLSAQGAGLPSSSRPKTPGRTRLRLCCSPGCKWLLGFALSVLLQLSREGAALCVHARA